MPRGRRAATQGHQARLELPVRLAQIRRPLALTPAQGRLQPFLDKAPLHPVHLAKADLQDVRDRLPGRAAFIELPFVAVQKNQGIDHFLGRMGSLARDRAQILSFRLVQRYHITTVPLK